MNDFLERRHGDAQNALGRGSSASATTSSRTKKLARGARAARRARSPARARALPARARRAVPRIAKPPTTRPPRRFASRSTRPSSCARPRRGQLRADSTAALGELLGEDALRSMIMLSRPRVDAARPRLPAHARRPGRAHAARGAADRRAGAGRGLRRLCARAGRADTSPIRAAPRCRAPTRRGRIASAIALDLDVVRTLNDAREAQRALGAGSAAAAAGIALEVDDLAVRERDFTTQIDHRAVARPVLVDVVRGPLPRGEARGAGDAPADPHAVPARPLLRGRVLDARARALALRAARGELGHGRPVHQPAGRADGRRAPDRKHPSADAADAGRSPTASPPPTSSTTSCTSSGRAAMAASRRVRWRRR